MIISNNRKSKEIRRIIWKKSKGVCAHCGNKSSHQTVDHIIPKEFEGTDDRRNLIPLCEECNRQRQTNTIELASFYSYASKQALDDARSYIFEWRLKHTDYAGELILKHPDQKMFYNGWM